MVCVFSKQTNVQHIAQRCYQSQYQDQMSHWRGTVINRVTQCQKQRIQSCVQRKRKGVLVCRVHVPCKRILGISCKVECVRSDLSSVLNVELMNSQLIHERPHKVIGGKVKDQAEGYGDGESWKGLFEDGQKEQS